MDLLYYSFEYNMLALFSLSSDHLVMVDDMCTLLHFNVAVVRWTIWSFIEG